MLENMLNQKSYQGFIFNGLTFYGTKTGSKLVCSEPMYLDTETSHLEINGKKYTWLSSIQVLWQPETHNDVLIFRKPSEFIDWLLNIKVKFDLSEAKRVNCYIHNAGYDLSYLVGFLQDIFESDYSAIVEGKTKITTYTQDFIRFVDSYKLSGRSLDKWSKDLNTEHQKQIGFYDYSKVIYQDTELTDEEIAYDKYDVIVLKECIEKTFSLYNDNVYTTPTTSTGYVRRFYREECKSNDTHFTKAQLKHNPDLKFKSYSNRTRYFYRNRLNEMQFKAAVRAFSGGYTHANRLHKAKVISEKVLHVDFASHYPSQLRTKKFPFGKPVDVFDLKNGSTWDVNDVVAFCEKTDNLAVVELYISDLKIKIDDYPFPAISASRCEIQDEHKVFMKKDNGRLLELHCDKDFVIFTCTNIDLKRILKQYNITCLVSTVTTYEAMYLPEEMADGLDKLYKLKSDKKAIHKEIEKKYGKGSPEEKEAALDLQLAKAWLNGVYGMFATKPKGDIDVEIDYTKEIEEIYKEITLLTPEELLNEHYKNQSNFLAYQIGIFVTAYAREALYEAMELFEYRDVLYCDTDSLFVIAKPGYKEKVEEYNKQHKKVFIKNKDNKKVYYDQLDFEADFEYSLYLHAKCYGGIIKHNDDYILSVTIAGVKDQELIGMYNGKPVYITREEELMFSDHIDEIAKRKLNGDSIIPTLDDMLRGLANIKENFVFKYCAGTTAENIIMVPQTIVINGHEIETAGGIIISSLEQKVIGDTDVEEVWIKK